MKYLLLILMVIAGCTPDDRDVGQVIAFVPVYASSSNVNEIGAQAPRETRHPGKIYAYGNFLFQIEQNEGIHIIDNSNPSVAHKISFLRVPSCSEIAIKSGYLYTNNQKDLLVFDISHATTPSLVKRLQDVFPDFSETHPPLPGVYFECPDPSKGAVVGWEEKMVLNPKCRR